MRRNWAGEPCCVPNCYRRAKKEVPFCERCWSAATDEERVGVQVAGHAPLYRPYIEVDVDASLPAVEYRRPDAKTPEGPWVSKYFEHSATGYLMWGEDHVGRLLQDYEARTTREAVAQSIAARRQRSHPSAAAEAA